MGNERLRVLSVSEDERLLRPRESVIATLGLSVVSCLSNQAIEKLDERFDLVVLGHSIAVEVARKLSLVARERSPEVRILLLTRTAHTLRDFEFADAVSLPDAPILLEQISQLLEL
jgi:hypothetical protein